MRFKRRLILETGLKQIEITPLIDCIFLLLIFFMLTSNFVVAPGITIKLPKASSSETVETKTLTVAVSSEDIIYVDQKAVTFGELDAQLEGFSGKPVFIKSDRDASLGVVVRIWDACRQHGIEKISIATTSQE
jgi:biopolymer transport protein ExbD